MTSFGRILLGCSAAAFIANAAHRRPRLLLPAILAAAKVVSAIGAGHDAADRSGGRQWIALPTIANMNINHREGAEYMKKLALDAGFQQARARGDRGVPGVFATLDAGAARWLALYFMYDVKHYDPRNGRRRRSKGGSSTAPAKAKR